MAVRGLRGRTVGPGALGRRGAPHALSSLLTAKPAWGHPCLWSSGGRWLRRDPGRDAQDRRQPLLPSSPTADPRTQERVPLQRQQRQERSWAPPAPAQGEEAAPRLPPGQPEGGHSGFPAAPNVQVSVERRPADQARKAPRATPTPRRTGVSWAPAAARNAPTGSCPRVTR